MVVEAKGEDEDGQRDAARNTRIRVTALYIQPSTLFALPGAQPVAMGLVSQHA